MAVPELTANPQSPWDFILNEGCFWIALITMIHSFIPFVITQTVCCQAGPGEGRQRNGVEGVVGIMGAYRRVKWLTH